MPTLTNSHGMHTSLEPHANVNSTLFALLFCQMMLTSFATFCFETHLVLRSGLSSQAKLKLNVMCFVAGLRTPLLSWLPTSQTTSQSTHQQRPGLDVSAEMKQWLHASTYKVESLRVHVFYKRHNMIFLQLGSQTKYVPHH